MLALSNNPPIEFPDNPGIGEVFTRRQWDGTKWIPAGLIPIWELAGDAPDDGLSYGRTEGDWRVLAPFEHVFTARMVNVQTGPSGWTLIHWDTVDVDTQGGWNNTTKRYTPQVPGLYLFVCLCPLLDGFLLQRSDNGGADHSFQIAVSNLNWFHTHAVVAYMNGTTDFIVTYGTVWGGSTEFNPYGYRNELSAYRLPSWSR